MNRREKNAERPLSVAVKVNGVECRFALDPNRSIADQVREVIRPGTEAELEEWVRTVEQVACL